MLFRLPNDVACAVAALLEPEERDLLRGVCHVAVSSAVCGRRRRDASCALILPPTDAARARALLTLLHREDPRRLARFAWIQLASPWHIALLQELGMGEHPRSVRVRVHDRATLTAICDRLHALPNLTALDLTGTPIQDLTSIAVLTRLRHLDLSRTDVKEMAPLAALTRLQVLIANDSIVEDLRGIENMTELRHLEVLPRRPGVPVRFPARHRLTNLETLIGERTWIENLANFVAPLGNLKHLNLNWFIDLQGNNFNVDELLLGVPQLETLDGMYGSVSTAALARLPALRIVRAKIHRDFDALATLPHLEHIELCPPAISPRTGHNGTDYRFLLQLPALTSLVIDQSSLRRTAGGAREHETFRLLEVLTRMPQLARLEVKQLVDGLNLEALIPHLPQLKHLTLREHWELPRLEWLRSCQSLRTLVIDFNNGDTDVSAIGALGNLEELTVRISWSSRGTQCDFSFLSPLVHHRSLTLDGPISDLAPLGSLTKLRRLRLRSTTNQPMKYHEALSRLTFLRELDIVKTSITDLTPLIQLYHLRTVKISPLANCRPLANSKHPRLLYLLHPTHNCLWMDEHHADKVRETSEADSTTPCCCGLQ